MIDPVRTFNNCSVWSGHAKKLLSIAFLTETSKADFISFEVRQWLKEMHAGLDSLELYYLICVSLAALLLIVFRKQKLYRKEEFRKLLHLIQVNSIIPLLFGFSNWKQACLAEVLLTLLIWILLVLFEKWKPGLFGKLIRERSPGEGRHSFATSFSTMAVLTAFFWGLFGEAGRFIALTGVLVWGYSDAAAALAGKRFGRHHFPAAFWNHKKSLEGSGADFAVSLLCALIVLFIGCNEGAFDFGTGLDGSLFFHVLMVSFVLALVSAISELLSWRGQDTWIVPGVVSLTALALIHPPMIVNLSDSVRWIILICFLAGLGAGLGTGLCGHSAAAVIVPMLFAFLDVPAYQATTVALASDVLASALSAIVYGRHHNINYKYGSIMLISIAFSTIIGSLAAMLVGNFALGTISILVMIALGIKFILKPVKSHKFAPEGKQEKKKIIESLICGLGIGGLCGFVGTGGGTLMLIVLTAVIGFDLKMAVGTSVFIMSFTAVIGAVTHIAAGGMPDLFIMLLCILFTLLFAQIGAVFANLVSGKVMNRAAGGVLLILGIAMLAMKMAGA